MKNYKSLWLNYNRTISEKNKSFLQRIYLEGFDICHPIIKNVILEIQVAAEELFHCGASVTACMDEDFQGIVLCKKEGALQENFQITAGNGVCTICASNEAAAMQGMFQVIRYILCEKELEGLELEDGPANPLRMLNHWDNMDGSIERGYSGNSFFFQNDQMIINERTKDYARLAASIGINGIVINNVNVKQAATYLITDRYFDQVRELADLFDSYGIGLYLSLNYAATIELGGPNSADPLDPAVISWWEEKIKEVYERVPNLKGFLVKADSEGRPGPFTYGRTQADGANMLADIIKPYGGVIIWRCFVYNCTQDWRDYKTDRARAGYDNFIGMDGDYHENVILQIKNGPMDFQIREPISPLLGGLKKTNQMLEVQIAQEYTGHQIDVCYLMPMFREILEFKTYCAEVNHQVKDIISGKTFGSRNTGIAAVTNTGMDANWTGNDLAGANLYGFGRLAWNPELTSEEILEEWIPMTFGDNQRVKEVIMGILMPSREIYEKYTSPLGIGWMVTPHVHYGCSVDGYEYSRWGTYHRADHLGLGVDRSSRGTGYCMQYAEENAAMYENMETCPEELLLFFHHVPYTYQLKTGKTLIQHIYDSHFEGVEGVERMIEQWESLEGLVAPDTYTLVRNRFSMQLNNAREWRDQVNSYFYRKSGIQDEKNRPIY